MSRFGLEAGLKRLGLDASKLEGVPQITEEHRVWFNPNVDNRWFMSIAELLNIITLFAILLPACTMVREKKGTVEQLLVTPLTPFQIMFPKVFSMVVVILAGTSLSLFGVLKLCFGVLLKGADLSLLWDSVLGMTVLGGALFGLGMRQLRGQFQ